MHKGTFKPYQKWATDWLAVNEANNSFAWGVRVCVRGGGVYIQLIVGERGVYIQLIVGGNH
jgi:hypothetical protein